MKDKIPLIIGIILVIALVVLIIIFGGIEKEGEETSNLKNVDISEQIYGFSAEIKEIKDKSLVLEGWIPMADVEQNPIKATIKAIVTNQTKIVKLKFPERIEGSDEPIYPEETKMSFDDLKVREKIDIGAADNISEKLKNGEEFEIKHIFIIE